MRTSWTLARQFVERLDATRGEALKTDSGVLYWDVTARDAKDEAVAARLRTLLEKSSVLGLKAHRGVPDHPTGPALATRITLNENKAEVKLATTDSAGTGWVTLEPITLKMTVVEPKVVAAEESKSGEKAVASETIDPEMRKAAQVADGVAAGLLSRLVGAKLSKGHRVKGHDTFQVRIINASPFVLNGVALWGTEDASTSPPAMLAGLSVPPRKSLTVPASPDLVERLRLKDGLRVFAADLSGL